MTRNFRLAELGQASPFRVEIVGEPRLCANGGNARAFYKVRLRPIAAEGFDVVLDQLKLCEDERGELFLSAPQLDPKRSWTGEWISLAEFGPHLKQILEKKLLEDYRARTGQRALALGVAP